MTEPAALALRLDRERRRAPLPVQLAGAGARPGAWPGALTPGQRLPSTRARWLPSSRVARGVVEQAFDQLHAEGWLDDPARGRARSSHDVGLRPDRERVRARRSAPGRRRLRASRSSASTRGRRGVDRASPGRMAPSLAGRVAPATPPARLPGPGGSARAARPAVAAHVAGHRGLACAADQVLVTAGTTHGLALLLARRRPPPGASGSRSRTRATAPPSRWRRPPAATSSTYRSTTTASTSPHCATSAARRRRGRLRHACPPAPARHRRCRRRGGSRSSPRHDGVAPGGRGRLRLGVPLRRRAAARARLSFGPTVVYLGTAAKSLAPGLRIGWLVGRRGAGRRARRRGAAQRHDHPSLADAAGVADDARGGSRRPGWCAPPAGCTPSAASWCATSARAGDGPLTGAVAGMYVTLPSCRARRRATRSAAAPAAGFERAVAGRLLSHRRRARARARLRGRDRRRAARGCLDVVDERCGGAGLTRGAVA